MIINNMDIKGSTKLLTVIGDPISHSLSPQIQNYFIKKAEIDYIYTAFNIKKEQLNDFFETAKLLNIKGFNVTMPLKELAFERVNHRDISANEAVNTVVNNNGILSGYSTDGNGFINAISSNGRTLKNKNALILGAGGTSKPVVKALLNANANVNICARTLTRAKEMVTDNHLYEWQKLEELCENTDILVNTTPLGMEKFDNFTNFSFLDRLPKNAIVFDMVYFPRKTQLLTEAENRKIETISGISQLIHQAALSFELFTNTKVSKETIEFLQNNLYS